MDGMISTEPKYVDHQHFGQILHSNESAEEISNVLFLLIHFTSSTLLGYDQG